MIRNLVIVLLTVFCVNVFGADWPQWRGEGRTGVSDEVGLLKKWPESGPKLLWVNDKIGEGYSSVSVSDGTIYITGSKEKVEHLTALDLKGNIKWQKPYGKAWKKDFSGARTTATIDEGFAFVVSGMGEASCFDVKTGEKKWTTEFFARYEGDHRGWGIGISPLVVDGKVICTPGGDKTTMVALDKKTGKVVWESKSVGGKTSYCSPISVERGGKKIIVEITAKYIIGVDAANGDILWSYDIKEYQGRKPKGVSCVTPIYHEGQIYITSGYNMGSIKLGLSDDGKSVEKVWTNKDLDTHIGGVVLVDGYIYGASWDGNRDGNWVCVDWKTGETKYDTKWGNKGQIIYADGMLYCYEEKSGNLGLTKATPEGFEIVSSFTITHGEDVHWMHPAISDGVMYVRHAEFLMAYDVKAK